MKWGARNAVLYELGALGAFVAKTLTNPPEPEEFRRAAAAVLKETERQDGWMYEATNGVRGQGGSLRYLIWSDVLRCPACRREVTLWDACVSRGPATIASLFTCPSCQHVAAVDGVERLTESVTDGVIGERLRRRKRQPVWGYGANGTSKWSRPVSTKDLALIDRIEEEPIPDVVPRVKVPWGDLYRSGYHLGVTHLHHFYTRRNLVMFGRLWERVEAHRGPLRDALRFWLLSYNASHGTIMTRVVAKAGQRDLVVTSAQPGVLYVSGLPVEKNLIAGLRRKASTIEKAFAVVHGRKGKIEVYQKSSCEVHLASGSVDYAFTDPPFGGNIPYAEVNFLNEAWLGRYTERTQEAIVSNSQGKTIDDYQELLTTALGEVRRVLKPRGKATVVFHSASADVWRALQSAYSEAGLSVERAGVLDKTQASFKQVTAAGTVRGDPLLLLGKCLTKTEQTVESVWHVAEHLRRQAFAALDPVEQTAQRLYSRLINYYLSLHQEVPLDADSFYQWHAAQPSLRGPAVARG